MSIALNGPIPVRERMWTRWILSSFVAAIALLVSLSCYHLYRAPSLGIRLEWNQPLKRWIVAHAEPDSVLKSGDAILQIGGIPAGRQELLDDSHSFQTDLEVFQYLRLKRAVFYALAASPAPVRLVRNGRDMVVSLPISRTGFSFLNSYAVIFVLVLSLCFFWIGIIVFIRMRLTAQSLVYFLMTMSYTMLLLTLAFLSTSVIAIEPFWCTLLHVLNSSLFFLSACFALHFSLLFPAPRSFIRRFPALIWICYGLIGLLLAIFDTVLLDQLTVACYILIFCSFGYALVVGRDPVERQQMKWVAAAFLFSVGSWLCINGIPLLLTGGYLLPDFIPGIIFISIPLFIGFAIHRYRLFDIDALFEGTFVYGFTIAALGIIDFGFLSLVGAAIKDGHGLGSLGNDLLSVILVVVLYAPVLYESRRLVKRLFRRDLPDEGAVIRSFIRKATGQSPERIVQVLAESVQGTYRTRSWRMIGKSDGEAADLLPQFQGRNEPVKLWERELSSKPGLENMLVALPLHRQESVEYMLLMGELASGRFYSRHDLTILKSLLMQASLLYENACLYEENLKQAQALMWEEKRNNMERERILKDLHDGLGGTTTNISLMAQMGKNLTSLPDIHKTFATISELSAESLSEIRSFLHSMDGSKISWDILAADLRHFGNRMLEPHDISFSIDCSLDGSDQIPDRYLCLIIFRIYKESLANIVKHSRARSVRTVFQIEPRRLFFSIEDDGVGIQKSNGHGRGLQNIRKRAEEIGGNLVIESGPGARIALSVPLPIKYPEATLEMNGPVR